MPSLICIIFRLDLLLSVEYTDMARHAKRVMTANGVDNVVTVLQGAVEDIELPIEEDGLDPEGPVDIMIRLVGNLCWRALCRMIL